MTWRDEVDRHRMVHMITIIQEQEQELERLLALNKEIVETLKRVRNVLTANDRLQNEYQDLRNVFELMEKAIAKAEGRPS